MTAFRFLLALCVGLCASMIATAQETTSEPAQDSAPPAPSAEPVERAPADAPVTDMAAWCANRDAAAIRYFPHRALERHQSGRVRLDCVIGENAKAASCQVISEEPAGFQFAEAAFNIACQFRFEEDRASTMRYYTDEAGRRHGVVSTTFRLDP